MKFTTSLAALTFLSAAVMFTAAAPTSAVSSTLASGTPTVMLEKRFPLPSIEWWNTKALHKRFLNRGRALPQGLTEAKVFREEKIMLPNYRVIRPGDVVTFDFVDDRLNMALDDVEVVDRIYYG
jgi:hypothetical protein